MVYHLVLTLLQYCLVYKIINLQRERERERESRGQPLNMDPSPIKLRDILCRGGRERKRRGHNITSQWFTLYTHIYTRFLHHKQPTHLPLVKENTECLVSLLFRILKLSKWTWSLYLENFIVLLLCAFNAFSFFLFCSFIFRERPISFILFQSLKN